MKRLVLLLAVALVVVWALPAVAGNENPGNGLPVNGAHYNLNLIGVENIKSAKMVGSQRHTIFVNIQASGAPVPGAPKVGSTIWLTRGDFQVCDGNSWDQAYGCDGNLLANTYAGGAPKYGAVFQLPCNTYIQAQSGEELVPCVDDPGNQYDTAKYRVFIRALGTPKGGPSADWSTCAYDTVDAEWVCNTHNDLIVREKGQSTFDDVTYELTSLLDVDVTVVGGQTITTNKRVQLFAPNYVDWYWEYLNKGVKLAQIRFYNVP